MVQEHQASWYWDQIESLVEVVVEPTNPEPEPTETKADDVVISAFATTDASPKSALPPPVLWVSTLLLIVLAACFIIVTTLRSRASSSSSPPLYSSSSAAAPSSSSSASQSSSSKSSRSSRKRQRRRQRKVSVPTPVSSPPSEVVVGTAADSSSSSGSSDSDSDSGEVLSSSSSSSSSLSSSAPPSFGVAARHAAAVSSLASVLERSGVPRARSLELAGRSYLRSMSSRAFSVSPVPASSEPQPPSSSRHLSFLEEVLDLKAALPPLALSLVGRSVPALLDVLRGVLSQRPDPLSGSAPSVSEALLLTTKYCLLWLCGEAGGGETTRLTITPKPTATTSLSRLVAPLSEYHPSSLLRSYVDESLSSLSLSGSGSGSPPFPWSCVLRQSLPLLYVLFLHRLATYLHLPSWCHSLLNVITVLSVLLLSVLYPLVASLPSTSDPSFALSFVSLVLSSLLSSPSFRLSLLVLLFRASLVGALRRRQQGGEGGGGGGGERTAKRLGDAAVAAVGLCWGLAGVGGGPS